MMALADPILAAVDVLAGLAEPCFAVDEDLVVRFINPAAAATVGRSVEDALGMCIAERWADAPDAPFPAACRETLAEGGTRRVEQEFGGRCFVTTISRAPAGLVVTYVDVTEQRRAEREAAWMAQREAALRRISETVARGAAPHVVLALVAREAAMLTGAHASAVLRFEAEADETTIMGSWRDGHPAPFDSQQPLTLTPGSVIRDVRRTGRTLRQESVTPRDTQWGRIGCRAHVVAPVYALGGLWGSVSLGWLESEPHPRAEQEVSAFTELASLAVASAAARDSLADQATRDPLTGLLNHRCFHERLREEFERARRYARPLALVLLDLDSFKHVNDSYGHQAGDALLSDIAERLRGATRAQDVLGRVGGDEFGVLLPETDGFHALLVAEHLRSAFEGVRIAGRAVTTSMGLCDLAHAGSPGDLFRLADGALYWSKVHGRDAACLYDPGIVRELSAQERADALERSQARTGLRGLARAIDAKDPSTRRHSDRVAALCERLAAELGWSSERVALLHEAALVHDVGKIGVPDAVLLKPGRLTPEEYEAVKQHAALGAEIVGEILTPEQVGWVRHHHERPDGRGYPDGLSGDEIADGARIIALADAFDVMTAARPYSFAKPVADAVSEVCHLAGTQFDPEVCSVLAALFARGELRQAASGSGSTPR